MDLTPILALISPEVITTISSILAIIGSFAVVATKLPVANPDSPMWYKIVRAVVDVIAMNFGNAKNAK